LNTEADVLFPEAVAARQVSGLMNRIKESGQWFGGKLQVCLRLKDF
jgi:hypothetical protein